jgi:hypothetical protein
MPIKTKKIFLLQPFRPEFESVYTLIRHAAQAAFPESRVFRVDEFQDTGTIADAIYQAIETSDLIICDVTHGNPNVMYELGYAHALRKPVILMASNLEHIPFDVHTVRMFIYDSKLPGNFIKNLRDLIAEAFKNPAAFANRPSVELSVNRVFVSYSHVDSPFLKRLMVHLRPLEKEGLIDLWVDTRLKAGDKWKKAIEEALSQARVAILLVTADFLASDFIVDNELPPLLAKAEATGTRIVPVILKPCRFARNRDLNIFHAVNDPRSPLVTLSEGEQEEVYDKVASAVENVMVASNSGLNRTTPLRGAAG